VFLGFCFILPKPAENNGEGIRRATLSEMKAPCPKHHDHPPVARPACWRSAPHPLRGKRFGFDRFRLLPFFR
jgi:hypothetical protein